ncbi:MAG: type I-U CRISPR-associated RAMP protein Csb1/Cas7u [Thermoanaerobaculum sp.]|nr:type I-U CRISPR-associated RAMP protein Csb1/Cas7u [Thermoanaerobaculum sp.]MDW7968695.1 type I-U CRISPR-associated RAMP protein Csb1/Cas7u [Thermoanaerobaculum sp.]
MSNQILTKFDRWLDAQATVVALVARQYLMPVEGKDAVIFPPTYPPPENFRGEWHGYNIDTFPDGSSVCLIDSVASQANRLEPMFKKPPYDGLVPQVRVKLAIKGGEVLEINLLDAGHRAADAVVRYSTLAEDLRKAFLDYAQGNAATLAKLAPTSLIFGVWDSRGTQVKASRIVRSVIRAYNVRLLHRSAVYIPPVLYEEKGVLEEIQEGSERKRRAEEGLVHNPASWSHGGVQVLGEIRRDMLCNLAQLRSLRASSEEETLSMRRYLLGLALVVFTATPESNLREGCELVPDPERPQVVDLVHDNGRREPWTLDPSEALEFAQEAAREFKFKEKQEAEFQAGRVVEALKKTKEERKKASSS